MHGSDTLRTMRHKSDGVKLECDPGPRRRLRLREGGVGVDAVLVAVAVGHGPRPPTGAPLPIHHRQKTRCSWLGNPDLIVGRQPVIIDRRTYAMVLLTYHSLAIAGP